MGAGAKELADRADTDRREDRLVLGVTDVHVHADALVGLHETPSARVEQLGLVLPCRER